MPNFCEFIKTCPIYAGMDQREKNVIAAKFCLGDYKNCARYKIATEKGREHVPKNLMPDGTLKE